MLKIVWNDFSAPQRHRVHGEKHFDVFKTNKPLCSLRLCALSSLPTRFRYPAPMADIELIDTHCHLTYGELGQDAEAEKLRSSNSELSGSDEGQKQEIARLTKENYKLRAGERWAEWITGALVLATGMALGALLSRISSRRGRQRLRL